MKKISILISLTLLFACCKNSLKEKIEKIIISEMNNPKSYEFVSFNLVDSISNKVYFKEQIDSLTTKINTVSYNLLDILFDKKHIKESIQLDSLSKEISFIRRKLIINKKNFRNNHKKIKLKEIEYKKKLGEYNYQKEVSYFEGIDYSIVRNEKTIIWDSLIKMERGKLSFYFNQAQPLLYQRYGIKNDSIINTFKFVDSIHNLVKKIKTKFYVYEFSFRERNNFKATVLSKKKIETFVNRKEISKIHE
jgi:hypothetical protein